MPVVTPVVASTVATDVFIVLHVPAGTDAFVSVMVSPLHTVDGTTVAKGNGCIVTTVSVAQPVGSRYVIADVPAFIPVTMPEAAPMVALVVELLVHRPPGSASLSVVVSPVHTFVLPVMSAGSGFTVMVTVVVHPLVDA